MQKSIFICKLPPKAFVRTNVIVVTLLYNFLFGCFLSTQVGISDGNKGFLNARVFEVFQ